ncbi:metal-sensitive transcriptional regulator [Desmospora profundinema]|uniref:DNA-binding FrmR family transcriptional regulator n=1 Tax=Desmospora profundinema TaxID=1571184 RepID=A0ABU1ILK0_9BACL|nr:metal-sensitive transcriptional regulator [Desmospora profundinema]MDR6224834.1 DNA-binding FrmR family transcriptional regulator [Desmospora profundinema]
MKETENEGKNTAVEQECSDQHEGRIPDPLKDNLIRRMNRIEGQVKGVRSMIERDVYCDDILNQMSAVQSALHSVSRLLLESHINTCVMERLKEGDREVTAEFLKTVSKLMR